MSRIYTDLKCEKCGSLLYKYISFGHPNEDFDYKCKCNECGHINIIHVKAMPLKSLGCLNVKSLFKSK